MSIFKQMFSSSGSDPSKANKPIPPEEDAVLEKVAKKVIQWRMAVPAIMFLESVKPLNYIGAQTMIFFQPIVQSIFTIKDYDDFRQAMERRENVENLLQKIERLDAVSYKKEKLYKKKYKEQKKNWKWYQRWLGIKQPRIEFSKEELESLEMDDKEEKGKE